MAVAAEEGRGLWIPPQVEAEEGREAADAKEQGAAVEATAATPAEGVVAAATPSVAVAVAVMVAKEKVPKVLAAAFSTMVSHQVPCFVEGEGGGARVRVALRARVDTFAASRERHKEKVR